MSASVAKQVKRPQSKPAAKSKGGKGGAPGGSGTGRVTPKPTARYTPPVPRSEKVSPRWVPVLMFGSLGLGMLIILANYVSLLPGDQPSNLYLLLGLVLITLGFVTATRYH